MSVTELRVISTSPPDTELLREANHRISNHLALLASMVQIQANAVARGPETLTRQEAHELLLEAASKIIGVGNLHRRLAQQPAKGVVNLCDYLIESSTALVASLGLGNRVSLVHRLVATCNVTPEQAQQIGLMVSEIIMNAVKHAHPTGIPVQMQMVCRREDDGRMTIEVGDDGVGLPEGTEAAANQGVGFKLIRSLARTLNAELRIESDSMGLTFLLMLPQAVQSMAVAAS
jgi:two-component sensor histidine kinase